MTEKKTVENRLDDLEASVQGFDKKWEHGWAKGENVGAAVTATGVTGSSQLASGEITGVSAGFKLWSFDYDLKAKLEERSLKSLKRDPENLDNRIREIKTSHENFVRRIAPIIGPINREFPGVKSDVARAHRRIDGLNDDLRDSRETLREERRAISQLRHGALQATPTLESLHRAVRTVATILGG
ncbi:hypothetical protein [Streptomyces sp. NPDC058614]|uniref:hypothetical protein n=1 Tax=Streptomyces sp. NPDC058614 TaxID=3346557 RepID=UPI00364A8661